MYCYQCEESIGPCSKVGVCGKSSEVSDLQDSLLYAIKVMSRNQNTDARMNRLIIDSLFTTITNVNFNENDLKARIQKAAEYAGISVEEIEKARGIEKESNEDIRSLKEILTYGLKGLAAYLHHAIVLGYDDEEIVKFLKEGLVATLDLNTVDELVSMVLKCGEYGVKTMALLDKANTETYGNPEPTTVPLQARDKPGILVSGHDLRDLQDLLEQTQGVGVDIYTHGEMLPANYYPFFKKFDNLVGNYGGSWWHQKEEFEKFNGPILMTTNCIVPPKDTYKDKIYTTGVTSFEGCQHIPDRLTGQRKNFSDIIEHAKKCAAPENLEEGTITGGFAHASALSVADKIVDAVKSGAITRFVVMAGCDGRHKERDYYTEFAKALPQSAVILTAGCAKYRYNKLDLGDIGGIPRVLDAGQCNDCYSLVVIAQKLAEAFEMKDINELPVSYNIAWYEQKAVLVLLALLHLGVKNIHLGPKLPKFVSPAVLDVLVKNFNIGGISTVEEDMKTMLPQ